MLSSFLTGFFLGISLIVAIGAQNTFVLRQGILKQHIFYIVLFCSISDALLIFLGIVGISFLLDDWIIEYSNIFFLSAGLWLFTYGILRLKSAFKSDSSIIRYNQDTSNLLSTISTVAVFTFANPHVYLDTMILIGSISQQFLGIQKFYFAIGSCSASFVWFFSLGYGAKILAPIMHKSVHWKIFDFVIAMIMFYISFKLVIQSGWHFDF